MNTTGDTRDHEDAGEAACRAAAAAAGKTADQADNCEDCEHRCPACPWRTTPDLQGLSDALLNPGPVERDENGYWCSRALPHCDEDVDYAKLLSAFGLETRIVDAESQMEIDAYEAMCEAGGCIAWTPLPPDGEGWVMVSLHDTEDGAVAFYVRPIWERAAAPHEPLKRIAEQVERLLLSATTFGGEIVEGYVIKTGALHQIIGILAGAGHYVEVPLPTAPAVEPDHAAVMRQALAVMKLAKRVMPEGLPGSNYANASAALEASIAALGGDSKPPVQPAA